MSAAWRTLDEASFASEPGGEREIVRHLADVVAPLHLSRDALDRLSTAVAETAMNAIEHGNHNDPRLPVDLCVRTDDEQVEVLVSDNGGLRALPDQPEIPDLDAKLEGLQRPRGWGLFLIRNMVDAMDVVPTPDDPSRHTARLRLRIDPPLSSGPEERHAQHV